VKGVLTKHVGTDHDASAVLLKAAAGFKSNKNAIDLARTFSDEVKLVTGKEHKGLYEDLAALRMVD